MTKVFTRGQASAASLGGAIGVLWAMFLLAYYSLWEGVSNFMLYVQILLFMATCAAFHVAGKEKSRKHKSLAFALLGLAILTIAIPELIAVANAEANSLFQLLKNVMYSLLGIALVIYAATVDSRRGVS